MGSDRLSDIPDVLSITSRTSERGALVELVGELDLATAGLFLREVTSLLRAPVDTIEIDVTRLTFTDSSGLHAFLEAKAAATRAGTTFRLGPVVPAVQRVIDLAGVATLLGQQNA